MKLKTLQWIKYPVLIAVGLVLWHILSRVLAGFLVLSSTYDPSMSTPDLFWMGFWQFNYTNDGYTAEQAALPLINVILPHGLVALAGVFVFLAVRFVMYLKRAGTARIATLSIIISAVALALAIFGNLPRMVG